MKIIYKPIVCKNNNFRLRLVARDEILIMLGCYARMSYQRRLSVSERATYDMIHDQYLRSPRSKQVRCLTIEQLASIAHVLNACGFKDTLVYKEIYAFINTLKTIDENNIVDKDQKKW